MKKKIFTTLFLGLFACANMLHAQLIFEETFDYEAGRPLIIDAIAGSDNFDGITGWSTQSNSKSGTNCFNITASPLTYSGYELSGLGRALKYNGTDGQGVFKLFESGVTDNTVYISFMINVPNELITGGDYIVGIKMEPSASSTNWGGRIFASVDPQFPGEEVTFSMNKSSTGSAVSTGTFFPANKTHLVVLKYKVGVLNGKSAAEEAGHYDDEMSLFVNPPMDGVEPATPLIKQIDPNQRDIYRYAESGAVMGSARGIYFRSSPEGNIPPYTIGGVRVGMAWSDVVPKASGMGKVTSDAFSYYIDGNNQIIISSSDFAYSGYELVSLVGQKVAAGNLSSNQIDASHLSAGVYVLNLKGTAQQASAKIIIR